MRGRGAGRGAALLLVGALLTSASAAGAQTTPDAVVPPVKSPETTPPAPAPDPTVPPAPPPSVPPPDPFRLPMDTGRTLLEQKAQARTDLAAAEPGLVNATVRRNELQQRWDGLTAHLAELDRIRANTHAQLALAKQRLGVSAAHAYVNSGSGRVGAAIRAVTETDDVMQASRDLHIINSYGEYEMDLVEQFEGEVADLDDEILSVSRLRAEVREKLDDANAFVAGIQAAVDDARRRLIEAELGIARFHELAATAGSPILGPNRLTATQLAEFVRRNGYTPNITVTIDELAQFYLEESAKLGVRGDVAWAQSILETGGFGFAGSMVEPEDNNYAGIGACDSCSRGFRFPDARMGARAQMQLLRVYTDKSVEKDSLPDPLLLPGTLKLGFRGKVQSWWDLTGTWATAADYGIRVYALYERMVLETADVVEPPPVVEPVPVVEPAP